jgi:hypothetical protein
MHARLPEIGLPNAPFSTDNKDSGLRISKEAPNDLANDLGTHATVRIIAMGAPIAAAGFFTRYYS